MLITDPSAPSPTDASENTAKPLLDLPCSGSPYAYPSVCTPETETTGSLIA
ncbi:hypothetical protein EWM64_g8008 [Hericium alpestre]|uniref:Uncharacterized protein n=1 Tax=Hericium alpestre TaxID=135208 RepID=A0A4Y9ZPQ6_9AGAM|nr:hypothetical protein EWM64_g8008 [Hericium alpestre]